MFTVQVGFGFTVPYVALYLDKEFQIHDPGQLAFLTGVVVGSVGVSAAIVGPLCGMIGDRYGRRSMFIRAMFGVALMIWAGGLVPNVASLVATRVAMGVGSGINPAGMAIVAEGTPTTRLAWALGVTASARALGQALGPIVGALLTSFLPLRAVFVAGGVLLLAVSTPVALLVREPAHSTARPGGSSMREAMGGKGPHGWRTTAVLWICLGLVFYAVAGMQQLIVLRIIAMHLQATALAAGVTFTVFGVATAVAATTYSRGTAAIGFRPVALVSAFLLGCAIAAAAFAPSVGLLIVCSAGAGLTYGAALPTLNSMLGFEAPARIRATIFGFAGSFTALGLGVGPIVSGAVASFFGLSAAMLSVAAAAFVVGLLMMAWGREPQAPSPPY
jgi:MFS family permease